MNWIFYSNLKCGINLENLTFITKSDEDGEFCIQFWGGAGNDSLDVNFMNENKRDDEFRRLIDLLSQEYDD